MCVQYISRSLRFLETSSYSISRSLQVPARRLEAPSVGVSGSWFLLREPRSYSTRSLQVQARRLEATAVGVSGSWFLSRETSSYSTRSLQVQARRLLGQAGHNVPTKSGFLIMHFTQTPWFIQCFSIQNFFDKSCECPPG